MIEVAGFDSWLLIAVYIQLDCDGLLLLARRSRKLKQRVFGQLLLLSSLVAACCAASARLLGCGFLLSPSSRGLGLGKMPDVGLERY